MIPGQAGNHYKRSLLVSHLDYCKGKKLGELDVAQAFSITKTHPKVTGIAGNVIEQSVLGLKPNPKQEPDIVVDSNRYEVKTTGLRKSKETEGQLEAKEPMSITAVSPEHITLEQYNDSAFLHKIERMLLFYYLYDSTKTVSASGYAQFPLLDYQFHEYDDFTEEERRTLEADWTSIRDFLAKLQTTYKEKCTEHYPRLSSELRDVLLLLDTAPKYPHPPRFRFKRTFVTAIYRRHLEASPQLEALPDQFTNRRELERKCGELSHKYNNWTIHSLLDEFHLTIPKKPNKGIAERIIVHMFGGTSKSMQEVEFFNKVGIVGKSIVLTENGKRTEDTKFFTIDFDEFFNDEIEFEDSQFYEYFSSHKILFTVFKEPSSEAPLLDNRFCGFGLVSFPESFLQNEVRPVWNQIRNLLRSHSLRNIVSIRKSTGLPVINKTGEIKSAPNFPKSSQGVVFVRGTSVDSRLKPECVNGIHMYYQQIWVRGSYLANLINGLNLL